LQVCLAHHEDVFLERYLAGDFCHYENAVENTYTNPNGIACCTPSPYGIYMCVKVCFSESPDEQHEIKSSTRKNDAIKRHSKHEMYEACQQNRTTVLQ
jgi:hypothetical protein